MNPYLLMAMLYGVMAAGALLLSSLSRLGLLSPFTGLEWVQLHAVTLGVLVQGVFGMVPRLTAVAAGRPRPRTRWDIWLSWNAGLLLLLVGIPLMDMVLITVGGTLALVAATLLLVQLVRLAPVSSDAKRVSGRPFYVAALGFLLLGAFLGTGLWQGWAEFLLVAEPKEVHVHANLWGFTALTFAGLLVDVYPRITRRPFGSPRSVHTILWLMALGALGLVMGPWTQVNLLTVAGLVMHTTGTIWLLWSLLRPAMVRRGVWVTGTSHILASYVWLLSTVVVAPAIVFEPAWFPAQQVADNGAAILVYAWVLQFCLALVPYLVTSIHPSSRPRLGGNALSLVTVNLAAVLYWASLFLVESQPLLQAAAFALWGIAIVAAAAGLWPSVRASLDRSEQESMTVAVDRGSTAA